MTEIHFLEEKINTLFVMLLQKCIKTYIHGAICLGNREIHHGMFEKNIPIQIQPGTSFTIQDIAKESRLIYTSYNQLAPELRFWHPFHKIEQELHLTPESPHMPSNIFCMHPRELNLIQKHITKHMRHWNSMTRGSYMDYFQTTNESQCIFHICHRIDDDMSNDIHPTTESCGNCNPRESFSTWIARKRFPLFYSVMQTLFKFDFIPGWVKSLSWHFIQVKIWQLCLTPMFIYLTYSPLKKSITIPYDKTERLQLFKSKYVLSRVGKSRNPIRRTLQQNGYLPGGTAELKLTNIPWQLFMIVGPFYSSAKEICTNWNNPANDMETKIQHGYRFAHLLNKPIFTLNIEMEPSVWNNHTSESNPLNMDAKKEELKQTLDDHHYHNANNDDNHNHNNKKKRYESNTSTQQMYKKLKQS